MQIVTLTTDFGTGDYYTAMLKGSILRKHAAVNFVDISHHFKKYDIVRAAFVLKHSWRHFPENTIHVITLNDLPKGSKEFILIHHHNHYFLGPNNGIFSLIFEEHPTKIYELPSAQNSSFPLIDIIPDAIEKIINKTPLSKIGKSQDQFIERLNLHPVISPNQLRGSVIYIDTYENATINIHRELFEQVQSGRDFKLYFKRHHPITKISDFYFDVPIGEPLCRFNPSNYLEIGINMGKAASLLNLKIDDTVQIDFL